MTTITCKGLEAELDEEGFLKEPRLWNEDLALALAGREEGFRGLTEEHWSVLRSIRTHFLEHGAAPPVRLLCQESGVPLKRVYELFPGGPARGARRVAGLPRPEECAWPKGEPS